MSERREAGIPPSSERHPRLPPQAAGAGDTGGATPAPYLDMLYDADCGLCTRTRDRVERLDRKHGRIRPVALQDVDPPDGVTRTDLERALHVVDTRTGGVTVGFEACVTLARALPSLAWLTPLAKVPGAGWVGHRVYRWVAENRRAAACVTAPQDLRPSPQEGSERRSA